VKRLPSMLICRAVLVVLILGSSSLSAAEIARLNKDNWSRLAPRGKEVDAIFGDVVLKNDRITAVVAFPTPTRHANLTVKNVGAALIDLTFNRGSNDQLSAYYPLAGRYRFSPKSLQVTVDGQVTKSLPAKGKVVSLSFDAPAGNGRPAAKVTYTLRDGSHHVTITSTLTNPLDKPITVTLSDSIRADKTFQMGVDPETHLFWAYDEWFRQGYGVVVMGDRQPAKAARGVIELHDADKNVRAKIAAKSTLTIERRVFPGRTLFAVRATARRLAGKPVDVVTTTVKDSNGPVANAKITALQNGKPYAWGRTWKKGMLVTELPPGEYTFRAEALGRPTAEVTRTIGGEKPQSVRIEMESCGYAKVTVTDDKGHAIPAKIAFHGIDGTKTPFFGPDSRTARVHNLCYTPNGRVKTELTPGKYEVVVSYGPEYDAAFEPIEVKRNETTELRVSLAHVVDSTGRISADFHSHSSPSGDNTTSQRGRVLNLLCEHIEFAPCTEHNRISSYTPHLKALKVEHLMATCPGIELTGQLLPVNHQNAFPLIHRPHRQDGGGPQINADPVVQIRRLAMWDNNSEKLVQTNHPDLQQIYGDRDLDGQPDTGFREMLDVMHVVEVHPPAKILLDPKTPPENRNDRRPIIRWLQLLNLGYRIPGVVNTDAHYTFHGSGWLRNYIRSKTDDPAEIDPMEIVAASKAGDIIMSTGPYMSVEAVSAESSRTRANPGDDLRLPDGKLVLHVSVQCPNWLDINRVQVFINGRPSPKLNFTRRKGSSGFSDKVVKFKAEIPVELKSDAHLIVVAAGEGLNMVKVMGEQYGKNMPIAVSNPIFVDVDGNGFQANGDLLGIPLIGAQP